jgi:hypothetical protein
MPILHKNITAETDIHNPKWFSNANNGDYAWKNEQGNLESIDELLLPAALNFVDGSVAPPTSNVGDIYVLSSGGSVNAGWGSVSLQDWVRYDGAAWNSITPQKSSLCYNENSDTLLSFNGLAWAAIGGGIDNVTSAQKAALSPNTGDFVYDTDLNSLQRYDGSVWVSVANGYGLVSVNDSNGVPTYYTDLKTAYDSTTSGIVVLHSDITVNTVNTITFKNGVYIDLNGYTYTYDVSDGSAVFNTSGIITNFEFGVYNGYVNRLNQSGGSYAINIGTNAKVDLSNLTVVNSSDKCLSTNSDTKAFGSRFEANGSGDGNLINSSGILNDGYLINSGTGENRCAGGTLYRVYCEAVSSNAIQITSAGEGYDLICKSVSGDGLRATSSSLIYNSIGESDSGNGVILGSLTNAYGCKGYSDSNIGFNCVSSTSEAYECEGFSNTSTGFSVGKLAEKCIAKTVSGGYAFLMDFIGTSLIKCIGTVESGTGHGVDVNQPNLIIIDCTLILADSSAYGLFAGARSMYFTGLKVKGSTQLALLTGSATNLWTATLDSAGNSAQL